MLCKNDQKHDIYLFVGTENIPKKIPFNNNIPLEKASGVCLKNSHIHSHKWVLHPQNSHSKNKSLHLEKELNICKRTKEKKHSCCHFPSQVTPLAIPLLFHTPWQSDQPSVKYATLKLLPMKSSPIPSSQTQHPPVHHC